MKVQKHPILLAVIVAAGWLLVPALADTAPVDGRAGDSATLQVVSYRSGLTGFFEPSTKTMYVYASDLKTTFMTVQVETLGESLKVIKGPPQ